jgi:hypothetical protein
MSVVSAEPPMVSRFNPWRQWKPILARLSDPEWSTLQDDVHRIANPLVACVHQYCRATGFECIEFVFLTNFVDTTPVRNYPGGIVAVPCDDVLSQARSQFPLSVPRGEHIYDGWVPLVDTSATAIAKALVEIDEVLTFVGYAHGTSVRWFPKYIEALVTPASQRTLTPEDRGEHDEVLLKLASLPASLRPSVARAAHWLLKAKHQRLTIERFVYLWFGFEGLLLALFEHANDIGLPIENLDATLSKKQRRQRQDAEIRTFLADPVNSDAVDAIQRAYFDIVVSIRRRCEAVLRALLGPSPIVDWPYGGPRAPSQLRTDVVHKGRSAYEIHQNYPVEEITARLERLANEVISRTLNRAWAGTPLPSKRQTFTMALPFINLVANAPNGGWEAVGDFNITHALLAAKGLL